MSSVPNPDKTTRRESVILVATLLAVAAKFAVFPLFDNRFHFAYLLVFCLTLVGALGQLRFRIPNGPFSDFSLR